MPRVGKHTRGMRFRRRTPRLSSRRVKRLGVASCHAPKSARVLRDSFWIHHHLHIWKESSQSHFPAFFFSCRRSIQAFFRKAAFRERAARPTRRHARTTTSSLAHRRPQGKKNGWWCVFFFDVVHRYCFLVVVQSRALTLSKIYRTKRLRAARGLSMSASRSKSFPRFATSPARNCCCCCFYCCCCCYFRVLAWSLALLSSRRRHRAISRRRCCCCCCCCCSSSSSNLPIVPRARLYIRRVEANVVCRAFGVRTRASVSRRAGRRRRRSTIQTTTTTRVTRCSPRSSHHRSLK